MMLLIMKPDAITAMLTLSTHILKWKYKHGDLFVNIKEIDCVNNSPIFVNICKKTTKTKAMAT